MRRYAELVSARGPMRFLSPSFTEFGPDGGISDDSVVYFSKLCPIELTQFRGGIPIMHPRHSAKAGSNVAN